jgi:hypothetical protein
MVKIWQFLTLTLTALNLGLTFSHVMEMPAKMKYGGSLYGTINNTLYLKFGTAPGIAVEIGSIAAALVLAYLVRRRGPVFWWTLAGALCLLAAQVLWWVTVAPANAQIRTWAAAVPADWTQVRDQWERSHAARFVLQLGGLGALLLALLREIPAAPSWTAARRESPSLASAR